MRKIIHDGVAVITCTHNLCFRAKKKKKKKKKKKILISFLFFF